MSVPLNVSAGLEHQLPDATRESPSRYREQDGQRWQEVFDKARAVEGADAGDPSWISEPARARDDTSVREPAPAPREVDGQAATPEQAPMASGGILQRVWRIPSAQKAQSLPAPTGGLAWPLSAGERRAAASQASGEAAEQPSQPSARSDRKNLATGAAPTGQAAVNVTWVTGSLGQVQLYLRASHLSRGDAIDLAWRLRPAMPSSQGGPATLVLNGTVLYDHPPATGQGVVFTG